MSATRSKAVHRLRLPILGTLFAVAGFAVLSWFIYTEALQELETLKFAKTDNVEWSMSQSEVDYLRFLEALSITPETATAQELAEIRLRFDLFFSRIDLFEQGALFAAFQDDAKLGPLLNTIEGRLDAMVEPVDGPDVGLILALPNIQQSALSMRSDVRELALEGVAFFARQSDQDRNQSAGTLTHLVYLTGAMLFVMAVLSFGLFYFNRQTHRQSTKVAQANSRLQGILETSLDGVIVTKNTGEILTLNPAAEQMFGHLAEDVRGVPVGDLIVPDHLRQAHRAGMARMLEGGERRVIGQGRVQLEACRQDGSIFPVEMALSAVNEDQDEVFVAFLRDMSQAHADEKELIKARDQALAGEKAKTDFLAVMSHEIRTPLNGILGTLQLMTREPLTQAQQKMLRNMDISGQLLLRHVNAVLDIVSAEAGTVSVREDVLNPGVLIQKIVDALGGAAAERGNVIEWSWNGSEKDWVLTDAHKLEQILLNLVGNAIKFTRDGRIAIGAAIEATADGSETLNLSVCDTGIGISQDHLPNVFDDFQTFDASLDRATPGSGLGLGIARRFAEALGGSISVSSTLGKGSQFDVSLPVKRVVAPVIVDKNPNRQAILSPKMNILVVDDNQINLDVMAAMLKHEGHGVTCSTSGLDAVQQAMAKRFDVILMDISMPGMDGVTATAHIRQGGGESSDVPVLAVSANVLPDDTRSYLEAGLSGVLGKPLTFEALQNALLAANGSSAPLAHSNDLLDQRQLDQMRKTLDKTALKTLFTRMMADADKLIVDLGPDADLPATAVLAHNVAGSAAMFGAQKFRLHLNDIEKLCLSDERDAFVRALPALGVCWRDSRAALETWHSKVI
ncbi:ATP-binding protein [uncultured Pelagimonas sp.]|uniref:hybrid sensor histidine kinase/response regulator n=1 Tax=uncultured Pelagimonas sp. TaxID=1618102 RepID=UPI002607814E|nr:ATP-binding protein [uncultured Pelagimonas sp.]